MGVGDEEETSVEEPKNGKKQGEKEKEKEKKIIK